MRGAHQAFSCQPVSSFAPFALSLRVSLGLAPSYGFGNPLSNLFLLCGADIIQIHTFSEQLFQYVAYKVLIDILCTEV